jgi:hypothetical protein
MAGGWGRGATGVRGAGLGLRQLPANAIANNQQCNVLYVELCWGGGSGPAGGASAASSE